MKKSKILLIALLFSVISCNKQDNPDQNPQIFSSSDLICRGSAPLKDDNPGPDQSCVQYSYSNQILSMTHYNGGFNCEPGNIRVDLAVEGDTLIVTESDSLHEARCNCRFDVDIRIENLKEAVYQVKFVEPLVQNYGFLQFTLDLKNQPEGMICVDRDFYPWGQ